jgi:uncharacterized protein involved in oxidation of intracellular sulfur
MNYLVIVNDTPDSERAYNGLRLAASLSRRVGVGLKVFLMGDAVAAARDGAVFTRDVGGLVSSLAQRDRPIGVCGSCIDARGIAASDLTRGSHRGSMEELTAWTVEADKVIVFS